MSPSSRISRLIPDLSVTIARFPACVLAAIAMCIVGNLEAAESSSFSTDELWRAYFAGTAAFLAGGAGHLFALARKWPASPAALLGVGLGALAALLCHFYTETGGDPVFVLPALTLAVMVAAYLRAGTTPGAFWLFNARFGLAIVLAIVITLIFCGGISAILASLDYLFEIRIGDSLYEHTWITGATLIGPIYGLSLVPDDLDEELTIGDETNLLERGISVLVNYIMVPLAMIYVVILHLYAIKIAWTWDLPKGQIGIMVLLFGLGGTATYLIARPWEERGTRLLRWFQGTWFWFTIVPVVLLAIAVWQRVSDYGVTPERYGLVLIAAWLIAMAAYLAMRRARVDSRVIMVSLAGLLLAASFGPWSARDISVASQMSRLIAIMQAHGYLKDNRLVETIPPPGVMSSKDASNAYSLVRFLREINALDRLAPIFAGRADDPFASTTNAWQLAGEINKQLRLNVGSRRHQGQELVSFHAQHSGQTSTDTNTVISGPHHARAGSRSTETDETNKVLVSIKDDGLSIQFENRSWQMSTFDILTHAKKHASTQSRELAPLRLDLPGNDGTTVLLISQITGYLGTTSAKLMNISFWVLLPAQ